MAWLGAVKQQAITWIYVDRDFYRLVYGVNNELRGILNE